MSRSAARDLFVQKRREHRADGERFLPLRVDLVPLPANWKPEHGPAPADAEPLVSVGGRWDRKAKRYAGDTDDAVTLRPHAGQMEAARWLAGYLEAHAEGRRPEVEVLSADGKTKRRSKVRTCALSGGRRGGKTTLGVWVALCFAIMRPGSRIWLVSESLPKTEELELELLELLPRSWFKHLGAPWFTFTLPNGSVIWLRSAHKPETLKRGRCDLAVLNEAQNMAKRAYVNIRGALADTAGLCILAANPPDTAEGQWVAELVEETMARRRAAVYFLLDNRLNPFIDREALEDLRAEVDERTFAIEVLGEFRPRADIVFPAWSSRDSVRPTPQTGSIMDAFTRKHFGRPFEAILGMDFQKHPHMAAVDVGAFLDPDDPAGELLWYRAETILDEATEDDLIDELLARGYRPADTVVIADASGSWQGSQRIKGRGSFDIFRRRDWVHIHKPDKRLESNPHIIDRVRIANARMKTADGKRHLFSDPGNVHLNRAFLQWENRNGVPSRTSFFAHVGDAATYPLCRFYPRRVPAAPVRYERVERVITGREADYEGVI